MDEDEGGGSNSHSAVGFGHSSNLAGFKFLQVKNIYTGNIQYDEAYVKIFFPYVRMKEEGPHRRLILS